MKNYKVRMLVLVQDKATSYPEIRPIDFDITENLPANVDPIRYLRGRLNEELSRAFSAKSVKVENIEEGCEENPLGGEN